MQKRESMKTFYWYDYETFGLSPKVQRIAQFAGIRTDQNLNVLDEHMFYCKPTHDCLPAPEACAVTGITPQLCEKNGLIGHSQRCAFLLCAQRRRKSEVGKK